jgi:hypothetical protein
MCAALEGLIGQDSGEVAVAGFPFPKEMLIKMLLEWIMKWLADKASEM